MTEDVGEMRDEVESLRREVARLRREVAEQREEAEAKEAQLERYAADLRETFKAERERALELRDSYVATVRGLCNAVEARDAYTAHHAERVAAFALAISRETGERLAGDPQIEFGFLLHDVGKVAIPDSILYKPQPLTDAERAVMQTHTQIGWEIVRDIGFLEQAREVVRSHHERWDGGGYPDGLRGEDIPLAARVFAVADTLDALTTTRPYRQASPIAEARKVIEGVGGSQFDPDVVRAFAHVEDAELERIRSEVGA